MPNLPTVDYTEMPVRVFLVALFLNLAWEVLHTPLYAGLPDSPVAKLCICALASAADALYVTIACSIALRINVRRHQVTFLAASGLIAAAIVEVFAQRWDVWHYSGAMPVIPLLQVGLSPGLQLAATSLAVYGVATAPEPVSLRHQRQL